MAVDAFFERRFRAIREFERNLVESGTAIVKIFLHISKGEQKKRLLPGIADGSSRAAFGLSEAGAGSDVVGMRGL